MRLLVQTIFLFFLLTQEVFADDASNWLKKEIDIILDAYKDNSFTKIERFQYIESTINQNFAGAGIGKFVAGKAWLAAEKDIKKEYIKLFKHHLALNIASLMEGYSNQTYSFIKTQQDKKNNVSMIDMEITNDTNKITVTWRIKKTKDDRYFIIDLIVADVSLVVTKRSEFNSMLKKIDYDLLKFNEILHTQNKLSYVKIIE